MDDHETAIHWSCVIQEVTKRIDPARYGDAGEYGKAVVDAATKIWDWHETCFSNNAPVRQRPASARSDPGEPPDVWPEDEEAYDAAYDPPTAPTGFIMVEASPCPGCGTLRVIKDGTGKNGLPWKAYMCPAKQRDESNDAHPALFLKRQGG